MLAANETCCFQLIHTSKTAHTLGRIRGAKAVIVANLNLVAKHHIDALLVTVTCQPPMTAVHARQSLNGGLSHLHAT